MVKLRSVEQLAVDGAHQSDEVLLYVLLWFVGLVGLHLGFRVMRVRESSRLAVERSESRLQAVIGSVADLVFTVDHEGRFDSTADEFEFDRLSIAGVQISGRRYDEVLPSHVAEQLGNAIARVRETGSIQTFDYELQIAGVNTIWCAKASPWYGGNGEMLGTVVVTNNMTMHRMGQERLNWHNQLFEGNERISSILLGVSDDGTKLERVAGEVAAMTHFPAVVIAVKSENGALSIAGSRGVDVSEIEMTPEFQHENSLLGRIIRDRTTTQIRGLEDVRRAVHPRFCGCGFRRVLGIPVMFGDQFLGLIYIADFNDDKFDAVLEKALRTTANNVAIHLLRMESDRARCRDGAELSAIYEQAPVIMALLDERANLIRINRAAKEYWGGQVTQHNAGSMGGLIDCVEALHSPMGCGHGPNCARCAFRHAILEGLSDGVPRRQVPIRKEVLRDGAIAIVDFLVSTAPLVLDGRRRLLLVMEDVTKARMADVQLREQAAMLEVSHDAIYVQGTDDRVESWNKGAEILYGVPRAEAVGRRFGDLIESASLLAEYAAGARQSPIIESRQTTIDGREIVVQVRRSEMLDEHGKVKAALVVSTDITEQHRLSRQLLRSQRLESIGTLASGLAHDLNNILTPIMMSIGLLRPKCDLESVDILDMVEACVRRGGDILKQVLLFARGNDAQRILLHPTHVLKEALSIVRETFPRTISVFGDADGDVWSIEADPAQMLQVLLNLCLNARDAMPGGGELRIVIRNRTIRPDDPRLHLRAEPGRFLTISVSDTGTGIEPKVIEKIFDPFFTTKPIGKGTGLGLATTLGIVEKQGGFIMVESEVGSGTTLTVFLPAAARPIAPARVPTSRVPLGDGARILVVDDEPALRELLCEMLRAAGYEAANARDGQDCLEVLRMDRDGFAILLTDLMMPRLDGIRMIKVVRREFPSLPIIGMTGASEDGLLREAADAGAALVLRKPFDSDALLQSIHQLHR